MKKKSSKSKNSTGSGSTLKVSFKDGEWQGPATAEGLMDALRAMPSIKKPLCIHPANLSGLAAEGRARIYVVVAEKLVYEVGNEARSYKMEPGRIAAQVAHAVSKLKLHYVLEHAGGVGENLHDLATDVASMGITTIVLGARDNKEVAHVADLAVQKQLLHAVFEDDNQAVYGTPERILTAIAIGPHIKEALTGVTDYLPLYTA